jgi:hypothetical protein
MVKGLHPLHRLVEHAAITAVVLWEECLTHFVPSVQLSRVFMLSLALGPSYLAILGPLEACHCERKLPEGAILCLVRARDREGTT